MKQYDDPIVHFKQVAAEMTRQALESKAPVVIELHREEQLEIGGNNRKNLGYGAISAIYHELGLDIFFNNRARSIKADYSVNAIMKLLIYSRILEPASKRRTFNNRGNYFERFDFSLEDVYRCLTFADKLEKDIQHHLHKVLKKRYGRDTETVYYDVTNYYFEIDEQDDLRKKGVSKEHRSSPIVQMGLFMDIDGIPLAYGLFPGNTNDCRTLLPMLSETKDAYGLGRAVIVADKGMNTASNIASCVLDGHGYIFSQTVRGGTKELKQYVLNEDGYKWAGEGWKAKSRLHSREITVKGIQGKEKKVRIEEKQVVFYSKAYDRKAKADRYPAVQKARDMELNPSKYNRAMSYGAARYIKNLAFDKKTGELLIQAGQAPVFDEAKLAEEELYDGYYVIVSSEIKKSDDEIIELYRGLWRIEESFRITKSDLEARPVYLSLQERIKAHFLICFIALVIVRLIQKRLGETFSIATITNSLSKASCSRLEQNWYVQDYSDEVIIALKDKFGIDLTRKYLQLGDIKKILATTKKTAV
ncbi:MAG: IS1634 family transposase [Holophagaceae bacterium]|nr:IS1634 family transposase [Holophagaceae bacterium]